MTQPNKTDLPQTFLIPAGLTSIIGVYFPKQNRFVLEPCFPVKDLARVYDGKPANVTWLDGPDAVGQKPTILRGG